MVANFRFTLRSSGRLTISICNRHSNSIALMIKRHNGIGRFKPNFSLIEKSAPLSWHAFSVQVLHGDFRLHPTHAFTVHSAARSATTHPHSTDSPFIHSHTLSTAALTHGAHAHGVSAVYSFTTSGALFRHPSLAFHLISPFQIIVCIHSHPSFHCFLPFVAFGWLTLFWRSFRFDSFWNSIQILFIFYDLKSNKITHHNSL